MKSFQICGGGAGTGVSAGGTVNVQNIGGATTSKLNNSTLKGNGNVNVVAHDYTNSEAMVGNIEIGGTGVAVGAAIDIQTVTRNVNADFVANSNDSINANNINVDANSKQGISSLAVSGSITATGAAVSNSTGVYNLKGTTSANASSLKGNVDNNFDVNANHLTNINTVGAMVGVAGEGAGVGATVVILNETDTTSANVDGLNLTANNSNITAKNKLNLTDQAYAVAVAGVGAGVEGLVEIGNIENTVKTTVNNSTLGKAENSSITVTADNTTNIDNTAGNGSGAGIGGAVGAGVEINTLDTKVSTNLSSSTLNAKDISVDAKDARTINQLGVGASIAGIGAGVQVGVMITNVGEKIADKYQSSANNGNDGTKVNPNDSINKANDAVTGNLTIVKGKDSKDSDDEKLNKSTVKKLGLKVNTDAATAGNGSANGGVTNTVKNSTLNAANTLKVTANGVSNFKQDGVAASGTGIGASAAGSIGIMNFKYNTDTNINNSTLTATKNIDINTITSGQNKLGLATACITGLGGAIGVGYGDLTTKGNNSVTLNKATIESKNGDVTINTKDTTQTELKAKSFEFSSGFSGGAVIGEVTSNATNSIDIKGGSIKGNNVNINAVRGESGKDTLKLDSTALSAALGFSGAALVADIDANDNVNLNIDSTATLNANTINLNATNNQQTSTDVDASSVALVSGNFTTVANKQSGTSVINVSKGATFAATNNNVTANMNGVQNLKVFALSVGAAAVGVNTSTVTDNATAGAKLNGIKFTTANSNINVTSNNNINQNAEVTGDSGGVLASGTSKLESVRTATNDVILVNSGDNKNFNTVNATANTNTNTSIDVISGTGGVLDISPEAAYLEDRGGNTTTVSVNGDFTATNINLTATTNENERRKVDATSASAVGYSGATLKHNDTTSTKLEIADSSDISTPNNLNFNSVNNINSKSELIGVGAGALRGNAADVTDGGNYTASLNLGNNTTYKTDKDFNAQSASVLNVKSSNLLKAYDFGSLTVANSVNGFGFNNSVTSGKTTINADNIYLKAGESGEADLSTIADHKGAVGAVETHAYNTINRADNVTVGDSSNLRAKTINLTSKTADNLELNLQSDVFNYSVIPLENAANMSLTLNQNNAINVGSKANFVADEEIVLDGAGTVTELVKSVRYFSTYDGDGENSVTTNDGTEKISAMTTNNVINVNGNIEAGTHNKIGITITGNNYKITDGSDWFDGKVTFNNTSTKNPYYTRWQEVTNAMNDYPSDSEQYKALDNERSSLISKMSGEGFLKNNKPVEYRTENNVAVLPEMRVSGADIKLYGDKMTGSGSITAHRGSNINIVRNTGGAIEVSNPITFGNLGGVVSFNGALAKSDNNLKVTSELSDVIPVINIENKSARANNNSGDIKIGGVIDNPAGNVKISTNTGSINSYGTINAQSVSMSAPNGSFTMINEQALVNLSDPITYFTFGDKDIAAYVQKRVSLEAGRGNTNLTFNNSRDFGNWLFNTLSLYGQSALMKKYIGATDQSSWVDAYVDQVNSKMEGGKIIAGGDILISAKDINVNGLIQSGFTNYTAEVDANKVNKLTYILLTDEDVLGNSDYLVTANYNKANVNDINAINGVVKNSDGYYDKQIELYYNPRTGNILANDIYSNGGNVTLKGNIISTGGGKIIVSNGAANVNVTNTTNHNLKINNIESLYNKGLVTIIDKNQNNKTSTFSSNGTYTPLKNLNYRWTGGGKYKLDTFHSLRIGSSEIIKAIGGTIWDLVNLDFDNLADSFIKSFYGKSSSIFIPTSYSAYSTGDAIKKNGIFIANGSSTPYLTINSSRKVDNTSRSDPDTDVLFESTSSFPYFDVGVKITWNEEENGTVNSTYSMKADNPIDIKFVQGSSIVDLNSSGGINDTTVTSKGLTLANLDSSNGGDINVNYNPIGTGSLSTYSKNKNTTINASGAVDFTIEQVDGGNITLNTTGDITGTDYGNYETLNLNSTKGKVDFYLDNFNISKALNIKAANDIDIYYLYESYDSSVLPIGTIESKTGNVAIKVPGSIVSAVTERNNTITEKQIANWKNTGILNTWNQTDLVNALNGNVFSKSPNTIDFAPTANIIAKQAILDIGGNIGSTGTAITISKNDLKKTENLKLLANARVGDLVWGSNSVTYTPHYPIGLTLKDNTSDWNLYLTGSPYNYINLAAADNKTAFNIKSDNGIGNSILIAAAGINITNSIGAKNLILRGGNGDISLTADITNNGYLDAMSGGNLSLNIECDVQLFPKKDKKIYIRNAIAGGNLTLNGSYINFYRADDNSYISAGQDNEINVTAYSFGDSNNNTPSILANGAYLTYQSGNSASLSNVYFNAITAEELKNKIYIRDISNLSFLRKVHSFFSPNNVFEHFNAKTSTPTPTSTSTSTSTSELKSILDEILKPSTKFEDELRDLFGRPKKTKNL